MGTGIVDDGIVDTSVIASVEEWNRPYEEEHALSSMRKAWVERRSARIIFIAACLVATVAAVGLAITYGSYDIGFLESYQILWDHIVGTIGDETKDRIVVELRLPRILGAVAAGAGLAVCGVVLQSILRNPLADPYTTGVSSGASLGAVLSMTAGVSVLGSSWDMIILAFLFSLIPLLVTVAVSTRRNASPTVVVMAGLGVMFLFNSITTVLMLLTDPNNLARVYRWQVGTLDGVTWDGLSIMLVVVAIGLIASFLLSERINLLSAGDDDAKSMGLNVEAIRVISLLTVGVIAAALVSFTGLIGFVGLVVPHIARMFVGSDNRYLIPASAALGGAILISADLTGRWVIAPTILQVGVVMSFIGGPTFIWLLLRKRETGW